MGNGYDGGEGDDLDHGMDQDAAAAYQRYNPLNASVSGAGKGTHASPLIALAWARVQACAFSLLVK